jgi:hypothetical protein
MGLFQEKNQRLKISCYCPFKGTVAWDFRPLVFSTNRPHIVPKFTPLNIFEFRFEVTEIFIFKVVPRGVIARSTLFCWVGYPAGLCSAGSDTPQDFVRRSIRPRRTLFYGVSDPADQASTINHTHLCHCSAGSDTKQALVPRGLLPCRILFYGVWNLAGFCSAGSDTSQDFVLWGIRPHW